MRLVCSLCHSLARYLQILHEKLPKKRQVVSIYKANMRQRLRYRADFCLKTGRKAAELPE